jgi:hypothetical protein
MTENSDRHRLLAVPKGTHGVSPRQMFVYRPDWPAVQSGTVALLFTNYSVGMAEIDYEAASQARVLVAAHLGHINDLAHQLMERQALAAEQLRIVDRIIRIVGDATDVLEGV